MMCQSFRSDLKEFYSTVKTDTSQVLSTLDRKFPDDEDDIQRSQETSTDGGDDDAWADEIEECLRRIEIIDTFTTPLDPEENDDMQAFL